MCVLITSNKKYPFSLEKWRLPNCVIAVLPAKSLSFSQQQRWFLNIVEDFEFEANNLQNIWENCVVFPTFLFFMFFMLFFLSPVFLLKKCFSCLFVSCFWCCLCFPCFFNGFLCSPYFFFCLDPRKGENNCRKVAIVNTTISGMAHLKVTSPFNFSFVFDFVSLFRFFSWFFFFAFSFKYISLLASVSEIYSRCVLCSRCSMKMWRPDDIGRDSQDWVGPPTRERAWLDYCCCWRS